MHCFASKDIFRGRQSSLFTSFVGVLFLFTAGNKSFILKRISLLYQLQCLLLLSAEDRGRAVNALSSDELNQSALVWYVSEEPPGGPNSNFVSLPVQTIKLHCLSFTKYLVSNETRTSSNLVYRDSALPMYVSLEQCASCHTPLQGTVHLTINGDLLQFTIRYFDSFCFKGMWVKPWSVYGQHLLLSVYECVDYLTNPWVVATT